MDRIQIEGGFDPSLAGFVGFLVHGESFFTVENYYGTNAGAGNPYVAFDPNSRTLYADDDEDVDGYAVVATVQPGGVVVAGDVEVIAG